MCGIGGWVSSGGLSADAAADRARGLIDRIARRGPDGQGHAVFRDGRVGLVHTRLAIIDPNSRSDQPMIDQASGAAISFNGEIYNYPKLRDQLLARGIRFGTTSDTEVLLRGYLAEGTSFFSKLRGMYAFAIFDPRKDVVLLHRDPYGIKPLHIHRSDEALLFSSYPSAVAEALGGASKDPAAAVSLAVLGCVIEPLTMYVGVQALGPGVLATCSVSRGGKLGWVEERIEPSAPWADRLPEPGERLDVLEAALAGSVRAHMTSDVPVAIFQSAGVDSAALSTIALQAGYRPTLLTLGFEDFRGTQLDEVPGARQVADQLGLEHRALYISKDVFLSLEDQYFKDMQNPTVDGVNTYVMSWFCHNEGFKVAISGTGGDEIFAGYPSFSQLPLAFRLGAFARSPLTRGAVRGFFVTLAKAVAPRFPKLRHAWRYFDSFQRLYLLRRAFYPFEELGSLLEPGAIDGGLDRFIQAYDQQSAESRGSGIPAVRRLESDIYMRSMLLKNSDWTGMAHGVEIRVPLVDVPLYRTLCNRWDDSPYTKSDLRALMHRLNPQYGTRPRMKTGFFVPHQVWSLPPAEQAQDLQTTQARGLRSWNRRVLVQQFGDWMLPQEAM